MRSPQEAFEECSLVLLRRFPTLYFILKSFKVVYVDESKVFKIPGFRGRVLAETDGRRIVLYKDWLSLDERDMVLTVIHELLHAILLHPIRKREMVIKKVSEGYGPREYLEILANAAVDFKVYECMRMMNIKVGERSYSRLSAEDIFEELIREAPKVGKIITDVYGKFSPDLVEILDVDGFILNMGREELENAELDELEEVIRRITVESVIAAKTAGISLSSFDEWLISYLSEYRINWRVLLRRHVAMGIARSYVRTWTKVNRKNPNFPGYREISRPVVWCFVDVSGSVGYDEFKQFMGEVLKASKEAAKTVLVLWDTDVRGEFVVKRLRDLEGVKFGRGGGTTFGPVIRGYGKRIRPTDVMTCLTDGVWRDEEEAERVLKGVKAISKILVYTVKPVKGFDICIKLEGMFNDRL